ncbi:MFS transporter [Nonomuraea sp. CA-141351]|uniref:MFS transporter n=1 Tax=Nonomuraea sp. CA-141351 TaxID=3239996 RepID=UPI003D89BFAC
MNSERSRWVALAVLCTGMLMIVLDVTVVNVALPAIQSDLGFTQSSLAWVVNAYLIAFGGLLLLAGRVGDLVSRRGVFLAGLAVFVLASLVCGLAGSQEVLIAARFVQGVGGAMTSAVILGVIVTMFPEPRERAKALGFYSFVASAGGSIGLLAGGVLTQGINWHWIFFINIPIGLATGVASVRLLPRDRGTGLGRGADLLGAVLITAALMLGVYTIVKPAAELGWGSAQTLSLGGASVLLLLLFVLRQAKARDPLVPLRIFRSANVSGANAIQALTVAGMFGMFFLGTLYLQQVLGYDSLTTGLAFLPHSVLMGALSLRYSERLVTRFGARATLLGGLVLIAAGLALFARVPVGGSYLVDVLPATLLLAVGISGAFPALAALAMSGATREDAGLASGLVNTTTQVGAAMGLAVLATLSATRTGQLAAEGRPEAEALTGGYQLAFLIGTALVAVSIAIALTVLKPERPEPAEDSEAHDELPLSVGH